MTPRDSRVGTRAPGRQQAPLRASLLPGSWWRCRGRVPIRRGALSPPAPQCDWSTEAQSAGEAARPRVGAEDTKGDRSGKTRLLTWVIRWAHVWCWRLRPWKPGVAQTDQRPGALLILKRLIQLSETGGTHPGSSCSMPCFALLSPKDGLNDPLGCLHLLHHLPAWEMEQLVSNCLLFSLCLLPPHAHLPPLAFHHACHNSPCPGCR